MGPFASPLIGTLDGNLTLGEERGIRKVGKHEVENRRKTVVKVMRLSMLGFVRFLSE